MASNKRLGMMFEQAVVTLLREDGYWVHFLTPDARGAQPFDIIAVKDGRARAIDCKTCSLPFITLRRLETNQQFAFDRWISCGNDMPEVICKFEDKVYRIPYSLLKKDKRVDLFGRIVWRRLENASRVF